ncbi:tRNA uridine(34) 5-carboxymethylaminomethyl modification radical SAM/GNAT enzyme Elp3 [Candidatus Thorarchaeota archaeon]|nr:MAG: tRNA uridine(34) 5-carboxymethylaminomethyl modification radical SAM/GNAT enzyme Elp3 [Candidatus Thorarchaeota archaeon]
MTVSENYDLYRAVIEALLRSDKVLSRQSINQIKNKICAEFGASRVPSNADILQAAIPEELEVLAPLMRKRPVRTVSGVSVVAVMTDPQACPHGKCAYCPGGPDLGVPQSYTGHEPATMRGIQHRFAPYEQVEGRLAQLAAIGHNIDKTELIVMGGDWCSKPFDYRERFVKGCIDGMNGKISRSLSEAKRFNEHASVRNVGMTFETRREWVTEQTINEMLEFGATRVELGVQSLSDETLKRVERGHGVEETIVATKKLRDSGLKICYHMMPGLPGNTPESDVKEFTTLFADSQFRPDMFKIYPTIVVKNTKLYNWWKEGKYSPYTNSQIVDLVAEAVSLMPEYVRIQRMQRDIPLHQIEAGLSVGNLRELVHKKMRKDGLRNPTIRYREIGHFQMRSKAEINAEDIEMIRRNYDAAGGEEIFLSYEEPDLDVIFGFLRLRIPSEEAFRPEISDKSCAIIRELRVYGPMVEIGQRDPEAWQHLGLGEKMIGFAENIGGEEYDAKRILVNSGIGVKPYYRALGFDDLGPFLSKPVQI